MEETGPTVGLVGLVDLFKAEGLTREQVERVLDAQVGDEPTLRDRLTSDIANLLMRSLGMPGRQSPQDVRQVRLSLAPGDSRGNAASGAARSPQEPGDSQESRDSMEQRRQDAEMQTEDGRWS